MRLGGRLDVGVVEDDDRRLAAELEVDPLDVGAPRSAATCMPARTEPVIDDHRRGRVLDQRAAGVAVAGDDVEHAGGRNSRGDLGQQQRGLGRGVARLEHDRVAGGDRRARTSRPPSSSGSSTGVDLADDADRLAPDPRGVARHVLARRPGPRARGPRRRRTGSGRPSAGSPRSRSAPSGLPVFSRLERRRARRRAPRSRRRSSAAPAAARSGVVSPPGLEGRRRPRRRRASTSAGAGDRGAWRRPRRSPGRRCRVVRAVGGVDVARRRRSCAATRRVSAHGALLSQVGRVRWSRL